MKSLVFGLGIFFCGVVSGANVITLHPPASVTLDPSLIANPNVETIVHCEGTEVTILDSFCSCPANRGDGSAADLVKTTVFSNGTQINTELSGFLQEDHCFSLLHGEFRERCTFHPPVASAEKTKKVTDDFPVAQPATDHK